LRLILAALIGVSSLVLGLVAQDAASTRAPSAAELDDIVRRVAARGTEYETTFRNLVGEELKRAEVFEQGGRVEKRREIVSDLLVYHPVRSSDGETTEYRDVRTVDGKAVKGRSERAVDLLAKASKAHSLSKELEAINRDGLRYDMSFSAIGHVIHQTGARVHFNEHEEFRIEWAGRGQIDGHDVITLDYRQLTSRPATSQESEQGLVRMFIRGRSWVDADTFKLRRERWEAAGTVSGSAELQPFLRRESLYVDSRFGILVPQHIDFEFYQRAKGTKGAPEFFLRERTRCTYGTFRRFEVTTDETIAP
jgi:hypothetical protein